MKSVAVILILLTTISICTAQKWKEFGFNASATAAKLFSKKQFINRPIGLYDIGGSRSNKTGLRGWRYAAGIIGADDIAEQEQAFNIRVGRFFVIPLTKINKNEYSKIEFITGADLLFLTQLDPTRNFEPFAFLGFPAGLKFNITKNVNLYMESVLLLNLDGLHSNIFRIEPPLSIFLNFKFYK